MSALTIRLFGAIQRQHISLSIVISWCSYSNLIPLSTIALVLSRVGIGGNQKADLAAKATLNLPHANLGILYTDLKFQIGKYIMSNW